MGLFGKKKKSELPPPVLPEGPEGLGMPPPPPEAPKREEPIDKDSFGDFSMPNPPKPINRLGLEISQSEMDADTQDFPGLDKDWSEFAAANSAAAPEPLPLLPEEGADEMPDLETVKEQEQQEEKLQKQEVPEDKPAERSHFPIDIDVSGPIYVEMETYGELMGEIGKLHVKLHMMDEMLVKMDTLREKEDFEMKRWHQSMDDMRKKLLYMDDALFESGR